MTSASIPGTGTLEPAGSPIGNGDGNPRGKPAVGGRIDQRLKIAAAARDQDAEAGAVTVNI